MLNDKKAIFNTDQKEYTIGQHKNLKCNLFPRVIHQFASFLLDIGLSPLLRVKENYEKNKKTKKGKKKTTENKP